MSQKTKTRLFLIDGSALAYRSYFAFINNPLTNKKGIPTSAVYGFTTTLLRLLEKENPQYLAVVFDSSEKTFRHEEFPEYKATREKMPDDMAEQLPYIQKIVEAMRIPYLMLPTYEADDIIGTLALKATQKGIEVSLVSGDKDFMQLLSPKVHMYNMKKGGLVEVLDESAPEKKWGVLPAQVIDLFALMGDNSDNVPGVPGVGEKTAGKLIQQFGSLESIYKKLNEVKPEKLKEKLKENEEQAELCKRLVTIQTNVPIPVDVTELKTNSFDIPRLRKLYEELDFHSLIAKLGKNAEATRTDQKKEKYILVKTEKALKELTQKLQKSSCFALDTETTSLNPLDAKLVGLSFSLSEGEAFFVSLGKNGLSENIVWKYLKKILENPKQEKGGQNIKYDRAVLQSAGIMLKGIVFDTMIESYLLDPETRQHNLDAMALKYFGIEKIRTEELIGKGKDQISMAEVNLDQLSHYACEDADITLRIHNLLAPQLEHKELNSLYRQVEIPLIEVLGDMERLGIKLEIKNLKNLSKEISKRLIELEKSIHKTAGEPFNVNSPKQLGPILFEKLKIQEKVGIKRIKKTKTGYATDQQTLENYAAHPIVASILEYRNLSKLKSTYADSLPELIHPKTKRIHTSFNQTITATGRLSSSDPNLQNIPIRTDLGLEIRKAFVAGEKGWKLISADYSQIELRILAHLAQDKNLIETFKKNEDVHSRTASLIFNVSQNKITPELRGRAKAINFGVIYGMGPQRLSRETGISLEEAKDFINAYFEKYSQIRKFIDSQLSFAKEHEYVTTLLGRRRRLQDINSSNPRLVSNAERIAVNTPIQGSAADLIKVAMIRIYQILKKKNFKAKLLLQVHDELVLEAPEEEVKTVSTIVKKEMENAIQLCVPIAVDVGIGNNWAEAH